MSSTIYFIAKLLFTGSILALVSSELIQFGDRYVKSLFKKGFNNKSEAYAQFAITTVALGLVPVGLSGFVFESLFSYPVIQGLCCSFIAAWITIHRQVSHWNYTSTTGLLDSFVLFVSTVVLLKPEFAFYVI